MSSKPSSPLSHVVKSTLCEFTNPGGDFFLKAAADLTESTVFSNDFFVQNGLSKLLLQLSASITSYGGGVIFTVYLDNVKIGMIAERPAADRQIDMGLSRNFYVPNIRKGTHNLRVTWQHWYAGRTQLDLNPGVDSSEHCQVVIWELQK